MLEGEVVDFVSDFKKKKGPRYVTIPVGDPKGEFGNKSQSQ
uniref:Uncharacterized protein n=1 Tax=Nelumbo nucifera TaxID=4432 RepID=A0A822YA96_NELNU|nr:TPA_asm: hypothetical protein HUJ06_030700 [Nelumbo nucifera]